MDFDRLIPIYVFAVPNPIDNNRLPVDRVTQSVPVTHFKPPLLGASETDYGPRSEVRVGRIWIGNQSLKSLREVSLLSFTNTFENIA